MPHFVADERTIRDAVADALINSLDHPYYEFYHPWDYAQDRVDKVIANQAFILGMKRAAYPAFFASISPGAADPEAAPADLRRRVPLSGGIPAVPPGHPPDGDLPPVRRGLAEAPWNDSLRARIFAQYDYFARTQPNPVSRANMRRRADALYDNVRLKQTPGEGPP